MPLIYFEVFCATCGKGLCKLTTVDERSGVNLHVEPCPSCLKAAANHAFDKGFIKGCESNTDQANNQDTGLEQHRDVLAASGSKN